MGTLHRKKRGTSDHRIIISDLKKGQDQDANRTAIAPSFEGTAKRVILVQHIDYVNATDDIGAQQGPGVPPPAPVQVTNLAVTPASNSQLNLTWDSIVDATSYKVYKGPNNFTPSSTYLIASPASNSYNNTGLFAGTTYYYRVSGVNATGEGTPSVQKSGLTTGTAPIIPSLWLKFDSNASDSSPNGWQYGNAVLRTPYVTGQFGQAAVFSHPSTPNGFPDYVSRENTSFLQMDTSNVGFSISMWIYQTDMSALDNRRILALKVDNSSNQWALNMTSSGRLQFQVKKSGTDYRREKTGFVANTWQHVVATFNAQTNALEVYRNAVAGQSSTGAYQYCQNTNYFYFSIGWDNYTDTPDFFQSFFKGYIDEVQYFKGVCLTPTQVTNLMNTNAT